MVAAATTAAGISAYNKPDDMLAYGCGENGGRAAGSIASNARPCCWKCARARTSGCSARAHGVAVRGSCCGPTPPTSCPWPCPTSRISSSEAPVPPAPFSGADGVMSGTLGPAGGPGTAPVADSRHRRGKIWGRQHADGGGQDALREHGVTREVEQLELKFFLVLYGLCDVMRAMYELYTLYNELFKKSIFVLPKQTVGHSSRWRERATALFFP